MAGPENSLASAADRLVEPAGRPRCQPDRLSWQGWQARGQAGRPLLAGQRPGWQAQLAGLTISRPKWLRCGKEQCFGLARAPVEHPKVV